jgi:hypothetical protein
MNTWIKSADHSALLRRYLKVKFPNKKISVRKAHASALHVYCEEVDRQLVLNALSAWRTGAVGMFDDYNPFNMVQGVDPKTGCMVIWNASLSDTLDNPVSVNVVINWITVIPETSWGR